MSDLRKVRAILFDVDGTLFSSEEIIHEIYIEEFTACKKRIGRPARIPSKTEIIEQIGRPVPVIFANLAPDLSRPEQDSLSNQILEGLVKGILSGRGHHYPGVAETIGALAERKYSIFTASNGRAPYVRAILESNGILKFFTGVPTVGGEIHNKTQLVQTILSANQLKPEEAALVGDRTSDRDAAIENHVPFIAARFGHGSPDEWGGASAMIDSIQDLLGLFPARN